MIPTDSVVSEPSVTQTPPTNPEGNVPPLAIVPPPTIDELTQPLPEKKIYVLDETERARIREIQQSFESIDEVVQVALEAAQRMGAGLREARAKFKADLEAKYGLDPAKKYTLSEDLGTLLEV